MPEQLRHGAHSARHSRLAVPGPSRTEPGTRRRLLCLALLPAGLVAVVAVAVVGYLLSGSRQAPGGGVTLTGVLLGAGVLTLAVAASAAVAAVCEAGALLARLTLLRRQATRVRVELQALLRKVERGERLKPPEGPPPAEPEEAPLDQLRHEIAVAGYAAEAAVAQAATAGLAGGADERVEVFVNLARRMQSFVHRQLEYLDELENDVEDPDLLKGLFQIDHLATRIRRHAENLAVLGGAISRRQWSRPVAMSEVLRSCMAEVEHYARIRLVPPIEGTVRGHAVADVVHLLAELVENATEFSAPQTQVLLRVQRVTAGLVIEVEDRGLGMTATEQNRMNAVLSGAERLDVAQLLEDGRVGLFVVSTLARRHDVVVQLQSNIYGGVQAVVVLPHELLGDESEGVYVPSSRPATTPPPPPHLPPPPAVPAGAPAVPIAASEARPPLPQRQRQQHLVPQLRDAPPATPGAFAAPGAGVDPGLMAAFRRGASLADGPEDLA
ncbi:sensor histidine kinase [Streptomyces millisiae]|uniref:histidine kinase n=1 Tax=Streptomyces millisiae TaxID=3075542 RepID=A0ABU2LIP3_9ACTN|nr:ATP-binding protein [Streptomyces sp. DSM 44918]MDT0317454.1 ATP-binding protein [Streptomyces sp. DSM 44918]